MAFSDLGFGLIVIDCLGLVGFGFFIDSLSRRYCMSLVNRVLYSVGFVSGF